jgi:hypothetical protein
MKTYARKSEVWLREKQKEKEKNRTVTIICQFQCFGFSMHCGQSLDRPVLSWYPAVSGLLIRLRCMADTCVFFPHSFHFPPHSIRLESDRVEDAGYIIHDIYIKTSFFNHGQTLQHFSSTDIIISSLADVVQES